MKDIDPLPYEVPNDKEARRLLTGMIQYECMTCHRPPRPHL